MKRTILPPNLFAAHGVPEGDLEGLALALHKMTMPKKRGRPRVVSSAQMLELTALWNYFRKQDRLNYPESPDEQTLYRFMRKYGKRVKVIGFRFQTPDGRRDAMERLKPFRRQLKRDRTANFRILRAPFRPILVANRADFRWQNAMMMRALGIIPHCGLIPRF